MPPHRLREFKIEVPSGERFDEVLTPDALALVARLERELGRARRELLERRGERQAELDAGGTLDFLARRARSARATGRSPLPADLADRRVEITGPAERKMVINALNSGAKVFMADFEDSNSPTWDNMVDGQVNLMRRGRPHDRVRRPERQGVPRWTRRPRRCCVRPRGWHLDEKHVLVDGEPVSGSLFDFGLYFFHNAQRAARARPRALLLPAQDGEPPRGAALERRLRRWRRTRSASPRGTIRATVLIETILAAFEMDEILYELRDHSAGLNAGRWDYIFSAIKKFQRPLDFVLPDRAR